MIIILDVVGVDLPLCIQCIFTCYAVPCDSGEICDILEEDESLLD